METVNLSDLRPGQYINLNGEIITKEQAVELIASGLKTPLYTVSDEHIEAALMDLSRARKEGREADDYCEPDPHAKRIIY